MTVFERRRLVRRLGRDASRCVRTSEQPSNEDLITALNHVQRLVLSGHSLEASISGTALSHPSHTILRLHDRMSRGETIESACRSILRSLESKNCPTAGERDASMVLRFLGLVDSIGGRVAEHIDSLVEILTERNHVRRERSTHAATSSASMRLLSWLPPLCGLWVISDSASVRTFSLSTVPGWTCLVLGMLLNILGRIWLERLVSAC